MFLNLDIDQICSIEKQVSYINDQDHENNCFHSTEMHVANYALDAKDGLIDFYTICMIMNLMLIMMSLKR